MATFAYRIRTTRKNALTKVFIRFNVDRKTSFYVETQYLVLSDAWDDKRQGMKSRFTYTDDFTEQQGRELMKNLAEMRSFILVAGNCDEAVLYVEPAELHLVKGQKVRITGGVFEGVIGEFVRIRHDRRVVVNIEGVMAVATTFIPPSLVEPIKE